MVRQGRPENLKIRILGASGSEVADRRAPAFLVDGESLLDAGTIGLSLKIREEQKIRRIILTHAHFDHIKGIPFMLDNLVTRGTANTITVISGRDVIRDLKTNIFNNKIWPDFTKIPTPDRPVLRYRTVCDSREERFNGYSLVMIRVNHSVPSYGIILTCPKGKRIAYTGDTGPTDRFWKKVDEYGVKHLIVESSFPNRLEELALKTGHLTPALLKKEIAKMGNPPPKIYLMHAKPQYLPEIEQEIQGIARDTIRYLRQEEVLTI
jgi:ribonuclease BN (tRNA processing enzyme)